MGNAIAPHKPKPFSQDLWVPWRTDTMGAYVSLDGFTSPLYSVGILLSSLISTYLDKGSFPYLHSLFNYQQMAPSRPWRDNQMLGLILPFALCGKHLLRWSPPSTHSNYWQSGLLWDPLMLYQNCPVMLYQNLYLVSKIQVAKRDEIRLLRGFSSIEW